MCQIGLCCASCPVLPYCDDLHSFIRSHTLDLKDFQLAVTMAFAAILFLYRQSISFWVLSFSSYPSLSCKLSTLSGLKVCIHGSHFNLLLGSFSCSLLLGCICLRLKFLVSPVYWKPVPQTVWFWITRLVMVQKSHMTARIPGVVI